jgi:hypothetical protein
MIDLKQLQTHADTTYHHVLCTSAVRVVRELLAMPIAIAVRTAIPLYI